MLPEEHLLLLCCQHHFRRLLLLGLRLGRLIHLLLFLLWLVLLCFLSILFHCLAGGDLPLLVGLHLGFLCGLLDLLKLPLLFLLSLHFGLLKLLLALLQELLAGLLDLLQSELGVRLCLFALQDELRCQLLELSCWIPQNHLGHLLVAAAPAAEALGPELLDQIAADLHHDEVPLLERGDGLQHPLHTQVVHLFDAEVHLWLVDGCPQVVASKAALFSPLQNHAV
mmetsp:Transcript_83115/g.149964  ORF Transcript_83115/g.149964 Transcript_83115/m.149964 type:complete len:225 (-) Transcript_83115:941-1615(-)